MAKQINKTPEIIAQMQKIAGDGVDVSNLPVFEAIAANGLPIRKRGSIYDRAVMQESTLVDLAAAINAGGLPLHTLHNQNGELPVGKVFEGKVVRNGQGQPELHVLFSVAPDSGLVASLDNGTIDEVSLGFLSAHALCSECGWDFFGDDATFLNFLDRTCANDHTIGVDGVHLNLSGLDRAYEMSLVSTGAVQNAKILSPSQAKLGGEVGQRLAANGLDLNATVLFLHGKLEADDAPKGDYGTHDQAGYADPGYQKDKKPRYPLKKNGKYDEERIRAAWNYINKKENADKYTSSEVSEIKDRIIAAWKDKIDPAGPPSADEGKNNSIATDPRALAASSKEKPMAGEVNLTELVTNLASAQANNTLKDAEITALKAQIETLKGQITELTAKIPAEPTEIQAQLDALKPQVDAATKFLRDQTRKALIATGADASKVDEMKIEDMVSAIEGAQAKLSTLFPAGGRARGAVEDAGDGKDKPASLSAFKTRK